MSLPARRLGDLIGFLMLDLAINGRFLSQPTTGVQRVAREITREIDGLIVDGELEARVRLLVHPSARLDGLDLQRIKTETVPGSARGHIWEQMALPGAVGKSRLLCLGNTGPVSLMMRTRRVSVVIHDLSYRLYPEAYRRRYRVGHRLLMPVLLRRANPIITVSETEKAMLATILPGVWPKIVVAQNGGWRDSPTPETRRGEEIEPLAPGYALYVGSFSQRKNFSGLLATAITLAREDDLRFVFVGSAGSILRETTFQIPVDVQDKIIFVGHIEDVGQLADLYRKAACLVFPSFYEASPLPPLEAMRFGCPVVASGIASMRERCGDAASYCDPSDHDSILSAVRAITQDPLQAADLAKRGYAREAIFSWRHQARQIVDAIIEADADIPQYMD